MCVDEKMEIDGCRREATRRLFDLIRGVPASEIRSSLTPARRLSDNVTVKHTPAAKFMNSGYDLIDKAVRENGVRNPVIFDQEVHLSHEFENNMQRFRFFDQIALSVPVDVLRFCRGGSTVTITCIVQVNEKRSESEVLNDGVAMKEYHTRPQKRDFKRKVSNIACIQSSIVDVLYKGVALDASVCTHPDTAARIHAMFLGASGLVTDLRSLNPGRPGGTFDVFFKHMEELLEANTAADDRRYGSAQMSQWLSLQDLINQVTAKCPPDTLVPSKTLLRLQFTPTNPYNRTALRFTNRSPLQHKIQSQASRRPLLRCKVQIFAMPCSRRR